MAASTPGYALHDVLAPLSSRYVDPDTIPWEESRPGMRMKTLYKDNEAREALMLIQTDPGCVLGEHVHTGTELTWVLEGSLEDDEGACSAGTFVWRPPGSRHQARTPNGATFICLFKGGAKSVDSDRVFPNFDE